MSDMQVPYHDKRSLAAVEKYMAAHKWDGYLNIGDFMDFDFISSFNKDSARLIEGKRFWKDYKIGNEILDRHQAIIRSKNKHAQFVMLEGNHEERVERFLNYNPALETLVEVEAGLKLKQRGFKWVRSWTKGDVYKLGKANFTHGQYTNNYHAAKMVNAYGDNIFYGHTHDVMTHAKVQRGNDKTIVGQSIGCLCDYNQSYMKGKPSNWQQAFAVFFVLPSGHFTYYIPRIFNHQFVGPDGEVYSG